jgi:hydroxymethylbilane synthase
VAAQLRERGAEVELILVATAGDQKSGPIERMGGEGVFTKEIQRALLDGRIDLAVHSLKDLPTAPTPGLVLAAVPERGSVRDVLVVSYAGRAAMSDLAFLTAGARIGTGSLRRRSQLLHVRPDLVMRDIRGNVETRLQKLERGEFDALVLAEAGLQRLGLLAENKDSRPLYEMLPAVGQGAIGLEIREEDATTHEVVTQIDHSPTHLAVMAERAMLVTLRGGCLAPVAGLGQVAGEELSLVGRVMSHDGVQQLDASDVVTVASSFSASCNAAVELGREVGKSLLVQGAEKLIVAARGGNRTS